MFSGAKYVTQGVKVEIPQFLQNILWYMIETMEVTEKDFFQIFKLSHLEVEGKSKQKIIHSQELNDYYKEYVIDVQSPVNASLYVIDNGDHCTLLLAEEY